MFHDDGASMVDENGVPRDLSFLYDDTAATMVDARWATKTGGFFYATDPSVVVRDPSLSSGETCSGSPESSFVTNKEDQQYASQISEQQYDGVFQHVKEHQDSLIVAQAVPTFHHHTTDGAEIPKAIEMEEPSHNRKDILDEVLLCPVRRCMNHYTLLGACCLLLIVGLTGASLAHARRRRQFRQSAFHVVKERIQAMINVDIEGPFEKAIRWISSHDYIYQKIELKDAELLQRVSIAATYFATSEVTWKRCGRQSDECQNPAAQWLGSFHECLWDGVRCDYFDRITDIDWRDSGEIEGEFPTGISYLWELTSLDLQKSQIRGTLPNLEALSRLRMLRLRNNTLTGELPISITNNTVLEDLDLSLNNLQGTISSSPLLATRRLQRLNLQGNRFQGRIQDVIEGLPVSIKELTLQDMRLSGSLPRAVNRLSNLKLISLGGNALSGTIPTELQDLSKLNHFSVSNGLATPQPFPTVLYDLPELESLSAEGCRLTGSLSNEGVAKWVHLELLNLANNELTGTLPLILTQDTEKRKGIDLSGNMLSGSLPRELCPRLKVDLKVDCSTGTLVCPCCDANC